MTSVQAPRLGNEPEETRHQYAECSTDDLIARISVLERQLREQADRVAALTTAPSQNQVRSGRLSLATTHDNLKAHTPRTRSLTPPRRLRPFDPNLYTTRHIALKFAYLGARYNGFEHANGNVLPKPTIEEVLWKALRKTRLISPNISDGSDQTMDVIWSETERLATYTRDKEAEKVRLDLNWEGCQYSKCGRTDRGVSAFGQVIGIRVRSNRPVEKEKSSHGPAPGDRDEAKDLLTPTLEGDVMPVINVDDLEVDAHAKPFDAIHDELPYVSILNAILPPDIRILAWCPNPPPAFDARFSCRERRYKYFFTNPAFCPIPGPSGLESRSDLSAAPRREGWLNIARMREAAKKLEGLHDFRNLCKIDASKQMPNCQRRVTFADVVEFPDPTTVFSDEAALAEHGYAVEANANATANNSGAAVGPPRVYAFCVHGSAFLWHQVRCMVAILFLVGQGLEPACIVDELLDVDNNPGRPTYEMADDLPLVLWDCIFPDHHDDPMTDSLEWICAGDDAAPVGIARKADGKFGLGGVVDALWSQWRGAKIQEVLAGGLLELAIRQGDGGALRRESRAESPIAAKRGQKIFDGSDRARNGGRYVSVMQKPRLESLETVNAKWLKLNGHKPRRNGAALDSTGD